MLPNVKTTRTPKKTMSLPRRCMTSDKGTFGAYTAEERWPIIVQNAIDDVDAELKDIKDRGDDSEQILEDGELLKKQLIEFREEILANTPLRKFTEQEIAIANIPLSFNETLDETADINKSWISSEWLFTEVYMYRRINVLFKSKKSPFWQEFDIFDRLKQSTFKASLHGVVELAIRYKKLSHELQSLDLSSGESQEVSKILFKEFTEVSLWGNATDLSLLTSISLEDIKSIQGAKAREASESKIVVNDTDKAWDALISSKPGNRRVDFVLDNSGFELYADFLMGAFLSRSKLASKCIFHAKDMPYMVSDVMMKDFETLSKDSEDRDFFPVTSGSEDDLALNDLATDIRDFIKEGSFEFRTDSFWTTELDYWNIDPSEKKYHGAEIHNDFTKSNLVIFKGDLNYRKLTGDRTWPRTTSWEAAIGPLAHNGVPTLSSRTCKATVQVASPEGKDEELSAVWEKDHPGQGSWWCCSGKWAVICFSDGK